MKSNEKFISLVMLGLLILVAACEKEKEGDPDTFQLSVSDEAFVAGSKLQYSTPESSFTLSYTSTQAKAVSRALSGDFWIGETELTYRLWVEIRDWANENGYQIESEGQPGSDVSFSSDHPATRVCWYDALVWCNALTAYFNSHNGDRPDYSYAYTIGGVPIRNSEVGNPEFDDMHVDEQATGFRIPTNAEWFRAAAFGGEGDLCPSGSEAHFDNESSTSAVCWYRLNSDMQSHPVAEKIPNALGLYDMSGNVSEIVLDRLDMYYGKNNIRGGAWNSNPEEVCVTGTHPVAEHTASYSVGFRLVRTPGLEHEQQ